MQLMTERRVRHLPIVQNDQLLGLVSIGDLVRQMIEHGEGRFEAAVRQSPPDAA